MPRVIVLANIARDLVAAAPVLRGQQEAGRRLTATPAPAARQTFTQEDEHGNFLKR